MSESPAAATATAGARATATVASLTGPEATADTLSRQSRATYGPSSGRLNHDPAGNAVVTQSANVNVRDFVVEARFFNPYDRAEKAWDYGFFFRDSGVDDEYRLIVDSDATWSLRLRTPGASQSREIATGQIGNLDVSPSGANTLRLVVAGDSALFFVNGQYVVTLDVSAKRTGGDISVATSFFSENAIAGRATRFDSFSVRTIQ
jgi:hypothetical protein